MSETQENAPNHDEGPLVVEEINKGHESDADKKTGKISTLQKCFSNNSSITFRRVTSSIC